MHGRRPRQRCPICGSDQLVATLFSHVGSTRCLTSLQFERRGQYFDAVRGPVVADLSRKLAKLLRRCGVIDVESPD